MADNLISAIILNYNGKKFLKECLDSISNQSVRNYEIILVDNNSTDDSVSFVSENYPNVKVVTLRENYGFTKGNNIGVEQASGRYIILLNNDTKVDRDFIEILYTTLKFTPNCGLVGANMHSFTPIKPDAIYHNGMSILGYCLVEVFNVPSKPFFVGGFALIFNRTKIRKPFDDDYFIFYEDNYLSWLNKLKGYNTRYTPKPILVHYGSGATGKRSRLKVFLGERNRTMNLLIFYSSNTLVKLLPLILLNMIVAPLRALLVYRRETYSTEYIKGYLWILIHFGLVMEKRRKIQAQRKVSDEEILKHFTYKISDGRYSKVLNTIAKLYCKVFGIQTFDLN